MSALAYAAGLFEGEGCVTHPRGRRAPQVTVQMVDKEPLERLAATLGGHVAGPYGPYTKNRQAFWQWKLNTGDEVERVYRALGPWLSPRRKRRFEEILSKKPADGWGRPEKTHCPQGHPYDEENTYHNKGTRQCRACRRVANRGYERERLANPSA